MHQETIAFKGRLSPESNHQCYEQTNRTYSKPSAEQWLEADEARHSGNAQIDLSEVHSVILKKQIHKWYHVFGQFLLISCPVLENTASRKWNQNRCANQSINQSYVYIFWRSIIVSNVCGFTGWFRAFKLPMRWRAASSTVCDSPIQNRHTQTLLVTEYTKI